MGNPRGRSGLRIAGGFGAAYGLHALLYVLFRWLGALRDFAPNPYLPDPATFLNAVFLAYTVALLIGTGLVALGWMARLLARARVRAGYGDPLRRAHAWVQAHGGWVHVLTVIPLVLATDYLWESIPGHVTPTWLGLGGIASVMVAIELSGLARRGVRALVAPVEQEAQAVASADPNAIIFQAVAVTPETRGAVAAMALLPILTIVTAGALSAHAARPVQDTITQAAILAYVLLAIGGAALFRRASRAAIGLDGILVTGSSRTRFVAYRELDDVHERGTDLEFVRAGRGVLRLQLHGQDAARRSEVLGKMRAAIAKAKEEKSDAAAQLVLSGDALSRAAQGAARYRAAAVSREQLWRLVEGASVEQGVRVSVGRALAETADDEERVRLRIAAEGCADPEVRNELARLLEEEPEAVEDPGEDRAAR